jgi:hypothetical protein
MKDISSYISFLLDDVPCEVVLNEDVYNITLITKNSNHFSFEELIPFIMEHKVNEVKRRLDKYFPNKEFNYDVTYIIEDK